MKLATTTVQRKERGPYRKGPKPTKCDIEGCTAKYYAKGLCSNHYNRKLQGKPIKFVKKTPEDCVFEGCNKEGHALGLCHGHWQQQSEGRPLTPLGTKVRADRNPNGRVCNECKVHKPWTEYYIFKARNVQRGTTIQYFSKCKECTRTAQNARVAKKRAERLNASN